MSKEMIAFGNINIEKPNFHHCKNLMLLEDVDMDNLLTSLWFVVSSNEKIVNTLLVTKMLIMKLNHYI